MTTPDKPARRAGLLWPLVGAGVALAALALVLVLALAQGGARSAGTSNEPAAAGGSATPHPSATGTPAPTPTPTMALRMAVVGDSISHGDSTDFSGGALGDFSWVRWAVDDRLTFAGGWAVPGALTEAMAQNVQPYDADVLVILAGTNDLAFGVAPDQTAAHLVQIAQTSGVGRVVLVGIPPNDFGADAVTRYNAALQGLAAEQGWEFADAAAALRTEHNTYREGLTWDGVHPTVEGARLLGEAIRTHILG